MSIRINHVRYIYNEDTEDEQIALRDVTCEIDEGEFVVVLGHNGSGKSTFAKLLNGLFVPSAGTVTVDGLDTADDDALFEIRTKVGVVFQNPDNQMIATIIEDDVAFGPENLGLDPAEINERVDWALDAVGMKDHRKGTPFRLSGGQKQRIAIAGVLAIKPKYLVLDESTSMLDPQGRASVLEVLHRLNRELGITVIAITHFMEEAVDADKIIVIDNGGIGYLGDRTLFADKEKLTAFDLELPPAAAVAQDLRDAGLDLGAVYTEKDLTEALCR